MGKSVPSAANKLQDLARGLISSNRPQHLKTPIRTRFVPDPTRPSCVGCVKMEGGSSSGGGASTEKGERRTALTEVVKDCVKRWFQETLKEAKGGDSAMQVLVGQMYYSGYGIPRDPQKGRAWINRASKSRSSVWKVGEKHPGYNASDSDSDEIKEDAK